MTIAYGCITRNPVYLSYYPLKDSEPFVTSQTDKENQLPNQTDTAVLLLQIVSQLVLELHHGKPHSRPVTLDSMLDRDLELDSLSRVELLQRIERQFQVRLPEKLLATAETPRDLLRGVINLQEAS